jgi:hypothetical protein
MHASSKWLAQVARAEVNARRAQLGLQLLMEHLHDTGRLSADEMRRLATFCRPLDLPDEVSGRHRDSRHDGRWQQEDEKLNVAWRS